MTRARLALLVVLVGVLAGAVGAFALPRPVTAIPSPPRLDVARTAPSAHLPRGLSLGIDVLPGTRRVVVRAPDPAGGPGWAIETLRGRFQLPPGVPRKRIGRELFGLRTCLRLGRVVGGRFGWLDGSGTFRPTGASSQEAPTRCRRDGDLDPLKYEQTTWVSHPTFGPAVPLAQVVWGRAAGPVAVRKETGGDLGATTSGGAFLAFAPVGGAVPALVVTATAADGRTRALRADDPLLRMRRLKTPARLGAQAPDPEGGAPYGVSVGRLADGRWCFGNAGRVVDGRVGDIDPRLDTFFDQTGFAYQCGPDHPIKAKYRALTRTRPLAYGFLTGGPPGPASAGRVALRTLSSTTVFAGIARSDVRAVRVRAPTQTRVLRPSGPAHAFVVPFNGTFPSGRVSFDVTFTDGTIVHQGEDPSL